MKYFGEMATLTFVTIHTDPQGWVSVIGLLLSICLSTIYPFYLPISPSDKPWTPAILRGMMLGDQTQWAGSQEIWLCDCPFSQRAEAICSLLVMQIPSLRAVTSPDRNEPKGCSQRTFHP